MKGLAIQLVDGLVVIYNYLYLPFLFCIFIKNIISFFLFFH